MAQGFGYLLAGAGPVAIGTLHAASGGWTVPLAVLTVLLVPQLIAGVLASRERHVLGPAATMGLCAWESTHAGGPARPARS
jgi:cyanate permease